MLADCPDPKEVSDFHFLQLRTLKLVKENENVPSKSLNIIAAASKYSLLFIGIEKGFKVLKLEDILHFDDDKECRNTVDNYACTVVVSETPSVLVLSASQKVLAICVELNTGTSANFYDVSTFNLDSNWQPFAVSSLSNPGIGLGDFIWNPAVEGLFAYCLSDGSLYITELTERSVKSIASVLTANATSVCWSPKGKQLVAGKSDGTFTQYKPTLQEVKTVAPPNLEEGPITVSSICWISNTTFAVVYVVGDTPNLFVVTTQKDSPVAYTNFYDVCLGNNSGPAQKYFLHLEPQWGLLICASIDSIEVAVVGDMPNWVQWDLKEDGKALLPGKDGATHAIGMGVMYSAQKPIIISESECYTPMPVIFFLTNNGLLVSFHMINDNPNAASLVSPPLVLSSKNMENGPTAADAARMVLKRSSSSAVQPLMPSTFAVGSVTTPMCSTFVVGSKPPVADPSSISQVKESQAAAAFGVIENPQKLSQPEEREMSFSIFGNKAPIENVSRPAEVVPVTPQGRHERISTETNSLLSTVEKRNALQSSRDSSYMAAIISEIQNFEKELQDLKQLQSTLPSIENEEDMVAMKVFALNLQNFQKDVSETMQSLNSDIFTLKNVLLESFVMVEEASSRERRRNDHSYITMLKERALDPVTAKRMQKINQHYQYLNTQLQEVSDKLDQEWINMLSNKKQSLRNNPNISSTEAIYKTIVNNQKIIHNLRKKIDILRKKAEEKKLRGVSKIGNWGGYHQRSGPEDLSKLADQFLQVKITFQEEREPPVAKKLSFESQNFLKKFLKNANLVTVRPTAVYSPSQSRLLSNAIPSEDFSISCQIQEKGDSLAQVTVTDLAKPDDTQPVPSVLETSQLKPLTQLSLSIENSKNESPILLRTPLYEPITPPEASEPLESVGKTFTNHTIRASILKDKQPASPMNYHPVPPVTDTSDSSVCKSKDSTSQNIGTSFLYSSKNSSDVPPNVSFSMSGKPSILVQKNFSEASTTSSVFSSTFSFSSNTQPSKSVFTNNNTSFTFPALQFGNSTTQQIDSSISTLKNISNQVNASVAPPILAQETKNLVVSESSVPGQQETTFTPKSTGIFSFSLGQNTSFTPTGAKSSQIASPSLIYSEPENKSVSHLSQRDDKVVSDISQTECSTGYFFQKSSTNVDPSNTNALENNDISTNLKITSVEPETPNVKIILSDNGVTTSSKSPAISKVLSVQSADESKTSDLNKTLDATVSINESTVTSVQEAGDTVIATSQTEITNAFADSSTLKQLATSAPSTNPKSSEILTTVSSVPVNSLLVSSASQLTVTTTVTAVVCTTPSVTSTVSVISQPDSLIPKSTVPPMPTLIPETTTSAPSTLFDQTVVSTSSVEATSDASENKTDSTPSVFGIKPAPLFRQTTTETPSFFGNTSPEVSAFSQTSVTQSSTFGQSNSSFTPASGSFFSQTPSFGTSTTMNNTDFNNQTSAFSFGKTAFGQTGSFGLAKSLFGQSTAPSFTQPSTTSSFTFGQTSNNLFGQGPFFSGLGGKPSEENTSKNVFGVSSSIKQSPETTNLFGNASATAFGGKSGSFSGGSFSAGSGSVAQSGFGSFQNTPQKPGGFGSPPAFGGAPSFGSPPAFGASPTFGSGNALASTFGQQQQQMSSNFSNFAAASSPTFGSLASQTPSFGSSPQMDPGFGNQGSTPLFGSTPVFGNSTFGNQPSGFGSPSSPPANSSAFTQWRN